MCVFSGDVFDLVHVLYDTCKYLAELRDRQLGGHLSRLSLALGRRAAADGRSISCHLSPAGRMIGYM